MQEDTRVISGFWKRILALFLDSILLGIVGALLGMFFYESFVQMGPAGRLIGFIIAMFYFGFLNSRLGKGQTLGKRIAKVKVVSVDGEYISSSKSLLRSVILMLPFFLNNLSLPSLPFEIFTSTILGLIIFVVGGGIFYFYIFNRKTRQSLHDLICRTYVVKADTSGSVTVNPVGRIHYIAFGLFTIFVLLFMFVISPKLATKNTFVNIMDVQKQLVQLDNVASASVIVGEFYSSGRASQQYINVNIDWKGSADSLDGPANDIARIIIDKYPEAQKKDFISVNMIRGYDIGIAASWNKFSVSFSPSKWQDRLKGKK